MSTTAASRYDVTVPAPIVRTVSGKVCGRWQNASSAAYLGIPFAAPPVGALRFAAPQPVASWDGVRSATEYGPTPQRRPFGPVSTIPEPSIPGDSTLNVNVFTPAPRDRRAHLPVLVWIHGGGYFAGSPSSSWYNGRSFNADGVVTVSISYRLGFQGFGWLDGAPLNRGLLDQVAALEWVQSNIEEFGGDPAQVTVAGQSAGGGSVLSLLGSPCAHGLFRSAISESGAFHNGDITQAEAVGRELANNVGVEPSVEGWGKVPESLILDHERKVNSLSGVPAGPTGAENLVRIIKEGFIGDSNLAFAPIVDGELLPYPTRKAYEQGVGSDVPLLMGSVRNEFSFAIPGKGDLAQAEAELRQADLSDAAIDQYSSEVHRIGEDRRIGQLLTTYMFRVGIADTAMRRNAGGSGSSTWMYDFAQISSVSNASTHCEEIPYVFDVLDDDHVATVLGDHPSQPLADVMHGIWVEFVSKGKLGFPSVAERSTGAIRFQGATRYDPEAYLLEHELVQLARTSISASPAGDGKM